MEFAKRRTFTVDAIGGEIHSQQNSLKTYATKPGSQNASDTATTINNVLESRKFRSVKFRLCT